MVGSPLPRILVERLEQVRSCGVICGAGVSVESGIRSYRGAGGLYDDPLLGDATVEALKGTTLARDPDRTWQSIGDLARQAGTALPNSAHLALADIEVRLDRFVLLTQNVDGLHQRAGSRNVIEIHGNIFDTTCRTCGQGDRLDPATLPDLWRAPRCGACGGILRPDVVLFGELLPGDKVEPLLDEFYLRPPDMILVAGTSALFPYITEPVMFAQQAGRLTVEVNPENTVLSDEVDFALHGPADELLPAIAHVIGTRGMRDTRHTRDSCNAHDTSAQRGDPFLEPAQRSIAPQLAKDH